LAMVGYTREDLRAGRVRWTDLTPPEFQAADVVKAREVRERGACAPYEKEYVRKDGTRVPILIGGAYLEGSSEEGLAVVVDITDRKRAEEALRASEERFRLAVTESPDMMFYQDAGLRFTWF